MSKAEAAQRIMEISVEIRDLLQEAMDLVTAEGSELDRQRAGAYWYPHIFISLGDLEATARDLEEEEDDD
jgi:hypothetical protein